MKSEFLSALAVGASKVAFSLRKHSPEIMVIAGVAGVITSAVMACKATRKIDPVIDEAKEAIADIKYHETEVEGNEAEEADMKKELVVTYAKAGWELTKLYAPALVVGALSVSSIFASTGILRKRNIEMAAGCAAITKSFQEYRARFVERYGADAEKALRYGIKSEKVEDSVLDDNGKEKKVKKTVEVMEAENLNRHSEYARYFDSNSKAYVRDDGMNLNFLTMEQNYANDVLQSRGHLLLNDVYDRLNIPRTEAGAHVGWIYNPKHPYGNDYVDFDITPVTRRNEDGILESVFALDFNVAGNILSYYPKI